MSNYHDKLTDLVEPQEGIHVSLLMPWEYEPDKVQANQIHLKNLIKQGKKQLAADGFLPPDIPLPDLDELFQPAEDLLRNGRLADEGGKGLALFLTPTRQQIYYLPMPVAEQVVIGPRFYIRPLLPLLHRDGRFYLLTLSQNQVALWEGTQDYLEQVDVPALPQNMDEALALEEPERALQFHTGTESGADRPAAYHGHDANKEKKGAILRYCRAINKALQNELAGEETLLLLAAVDYLQPLYEEANTYNHLLPEVISGNPDNLGDHELRAQAAPIMQQYFAQHKNNALHQYHDLAGTKKTSHAITEIMPAAAHGRVETLFMAADNQMKWGHFDFEQNKLKTCQENTFACEDLLNLAATNTLLQGGNLYAVQPEEMPNKASIAAVFRYVV